MVADRFRLRYKLTPEHWKAFVAMSFRRMRRGHALKDFFWLMSIYALFIGVVALLPVAGLMRERDALHLFLGISVGMALFLLLTVVMRSRSAARRFNGRDTLIGDFRLVAYEGGGIQITGDHMHSSFDWSAFVDVSQTPKLLVLWQGQGTGMIIPDNAFADDTEQQAFVDFVIERIDAHKPVE